MASEEDSGAFSLRDASASISPLSGAQGPWATHFAQVALKTAFGPIVQVVGDSLMSRGAQSIDELHKHTQLDVATLKKALLTLIQQDIVLPRYEQAPTRGGAAAAKKPRPPRVVYAVQVDSLRHRSRFAHYLLWIKQCFGPECEYILQTLLVHGKLSSAQVLQLTFSSIAEKGRLAAQEVHRIQLANAIAEAAKTGAAVAKPPPPQPAPNAFDRARIHDVFRQLVASQYIKRAQGLTSPEELAARAAAAAAAAAAGESEGSSSVNQNILQTFLANQAASVAKADAEREATTAAAAAAGAQEALRASTAASVAAAAAAAAPAKPAGKKRKKIIADDDDAEAGAGDAAGGADASSPAKPAAKRAKKKTKKELEQEAKEAKLAELRAARAKEEADVQASLDRAGQAAASGDAAAAGESGVSVVHDDEHILWTVNHAQFVWEFRKKAVVDYVTAEHSAACGFLVAQMMREYPMADQGRHPPVYDTPALFALCEQAAEKQLVLNPVPSERAADDCVTQLLGDATNFFERKSHPQGYIINMATLFEELRLKHIQALCRARHGPLAARIFRCLLQSQRLEETQLSELCTAPRKSVRSLLYLLQRSAVVSVQEVPRTSERMPQKTFYLWGVPRTEVCARYLDELYFAWCNLRLRGATEAERAKPLLDKVDTHNTISEAERRQVEQWKKAADRIEVALHKLNQIIMLFADF